MIFVLTKNTWTVFVLMTCSRDLGDRYSVKCPRSESRKMKENDDYITIILITSHLWPHFPRFPSLVALLLLHSVGPLIFSDASILCLAIDTLSNLPEWSWTPHRMMFSIDTDKDVTGKVACLGFYCCEQTPWPSQLFFLSFMYITSQLQFSLLPLLLRSLKKEKSRHPRDLANRAQQITIRPGTNPHNKTGWGGGWRERVVGEATEIVNFVGRVDVET